MQRRSQRASSSNVQANATLAAHSVKATGWRDVVGGLFLICRDGGFFSDSSQAQRNTRAKPWEMLIV